jgi:hypothetical protein
MRRYQLKRDESGETEKFKGLRVSELVPAGKREANGAAVAGTFDASDDRDTGGRYAWEYEGSTTLRSIQLAAVVISVIIACLYQMWPLWARVVVWYLCARGKGGAGARASAPNSPPDPPFPARPAP